MISCYLFEYRIEITVTQCASDDGVYEGSEVTGLLV